MTYGEAKKIDDKNKAVELEKKNRSSVAPPSGTNGPKAPEIKVELASPNKEPRLDIFNAKEDSESENDELSLNKPKRKDSKAVRKFKFLFLKSKVGSKANSPSGSNSSKVGQNKAVTERSIAQSAHTIEMMKNRSAKWRADNERTAVHYKLIEEEEEKKELPAL